jgi:hypothetical protein
MTNTVWKGFAFCGIGFVVLTVAALGYFLVQTQTQFPGVSFDHASEALTMRIIGDFHRDYNLKCSEKNKELGCRIASQLQEERGSYGDFLSVQKCTVNKASEPPRLEACTSSFSKGDAHEYFLMFYAEDDSYLFEYSVQLGDKNTSIPY